MTVITPFSGNSNYQLELTLTVSDYNASTGKYTVEAVMGMRQLGGANISGTVELAYGNGHAGDGGIPRTYDFAGYDYLEILRWSYPQMPTFFDGSPIEEYPLSYFTATVDQASGAALGSAKLADHAAPPGTPPATVPAINTELVVAGQPLVITLPRADPAYTHVLSYSVGYEGSPKHPIASNVAQSYVWRVPSTLYDSTPDFGFSWKPFKIWATTYDGATKLGDRVVYGTLLPPTGEEPTVTGFAAVDANAIVADEVGAYVQGLSRLRLTNITATAKHGASIAETRLSIQGADMKIGDIRPLVAAGSIPVAAVARDTRGVEGVLAGSIAVLAYQPPGPLSATARRTDATGTPDTKGDRLSVTINATVASLLNGTQRNSIVSIQVHSRERGETGWVLRNTLTPAGLTYVGTAPVGDLSTVFDPEKSWEIKVTLADKFSETIAATTVAQGGVTLHLKGTAVGVGKEWERGALDVGGAIYTPGGLVIDESTAVSAATQAQVNAGEDGASYVSPATLAGWTQSDTGWVDLSAYLLPGFTGSVRGRIVGKHVEISSNSISGTVPSAAGSVDIMGGLPALWRPEGQNRFGGIYANGYSGSVWIRPAGTVAVANRSGASWSSLLFSVTYLLG